MNVDVHVINISKGMYSIYMCVNICTYIGYLFFPRILRCREPCGILSSQPPILQADGSINAQCDGAEFQSQVGKNQEKTRKFLRRAKKQSREIGKEVFLFSNY